MQQRRKEKGKEKVYTEQTDEQLPHSTQTGTSSDREDLPILERPRRGAGEYRRREMEIGEGRREQETDRPPNGTSRPAISHPLMHEDSSAPEGSQQAERFPRTLSPKGEGIVDLAANQGIAQANNPSYWQRWAERLERLREQGGKQKKKARETLRRWHPYKKRDRSDGDGGQGGSAPTH